MPQQPLSIVGVEDLKIVGMEDIPPAEPRTKIPASLQMAANLGGAPGVALWSQLPEWLTKTADKVIAPAMRVAPSVGGGIVGSAFGPVGTVIGAGLGAGVGELGAEALEVQTGERADLNPKQVAVQTALGAVPVVGKARGVLPTVLSRGAQGGALAGVGSVASALAEGETPSLSDVATATAVGTSIGALGGRLEASLNQPAARHPSIETPPVDAPPMVPRTQPSSVAPQRVPEIVEVIDIPPVTPEQKLPKPKPQKTRRQLREELFAEFGARGADEATDHATPYSVDKGAAHSGKGVFRKEPLPKDAPGGEVGAKLAELNQRGPRSGWRNERGEVNPEAIAAVGGATAGGLAGAATGEDAEDRLQNAILGAGAGLAVGKAAGRALRRPAPVADVTPPPALSRPHAPAAMDQPLDIILNPVDAQGRPLGGYAGPEVRPSPLDTAPPPPRLGNKELAEYMGVTRAVRAAAKRTDGDVIPEQRPLDEARKANDEKFVARQPEPFQDGIREIIKENNHFEAQRRGVQPVERTNALARYIQTERQKLLPKGTALNAEELKAYADNIATVTDRIDELSKEITSGNSTPATLAALEKARIEQHILLANAMGARAETGRALNIHKQFAQIYQSKDALALEQAMKIPGIDMEEVAKKLATLKTDAEKLDYLRSLQKHSPLDMARSMYYANILSGVRTHIRNVFGNTINSAFHAASQVAATGYDLAKSKVTGSPRTMFFGELKPQIVGAVMGVKQGIDDALFTLQHGYTPKALGTFDVPRPELPGGGKNPFNLVGRTLEAEDQLFYSINYNRELYGRLYAKARMKGLSGEQLADQVAAWKLNPPRDVAEAAEKAALHAVFKEDPGKWTQGITGLKKSIPWLDFVMPFVKTPANILRQGIESTPLLVATQQGRDALRAGGREQAEAVGRAALGTTALAALAYWAAQGKISGSGPTDPEQRAALMESGWRPNSIRIGDTWISFDQIQPLAQPLYAIANAWEKYREDGKVDPTHVAGAVAKATVDQSFFSGLSDLNNALSDPDRYAEQFMQRVSQGFVPFSGLQRNIAQAMDTTVRQPKGVVEGVKSIVPGLSKTVEPKLDRLGNEVERSGGSVGQLMPVNIGTPSKDPVVQELTRLKVDSLGVPPKYLDATSRDPKIELTIDERKRMGAAVRQELEKLFKHPRWRSLDEDTAREKIRQAASRGRLRVTREIRRQRRKATKTAS